MAQPKVFTSYSHEDTEWVREFAEALRDEDVDVWQVRAGDSFTIALEEGLRGSDAIVAVLSAANVRRPNTLFDLGVALGTGKRLVQSYRPASIGPSFRTNFGADGIS